MDNIRSFSSLHLRPIALFVLLATPGAAAFAAANLAIVPNGKLPTTVAFGSTVTANFTVTNKTSKPQSGYTLQGVPSTVTQDASTGNCPAVINLSPSQQCNLALTISGGVQSSFALCGGSACSTSSVPLQISVVPGGPKLLLAAGTYVDTSSSPFRSLLMALRTGTGAWSYPIDHNPTTLPSDLVNSLENQLLSVTCNESQSLCVSGGSYGTSKNVFPTIAMSTNQGVSWTYPVDSSSYTFDVIGDFANKFTSVGCSGDVCIGAGQVITPVTKLNRSVTYSQPILTQTTDAGSYWSFVDLPVPQDSSILSGQLNGATCLGQTCLAAGSYEINFNLLAGPTSSYFLLYQTTNRGSMWDIGIDLQNPSTQPTNITDTGLFSSVSCNSKVCMAAGGYSTFPLQEGIIPALAQNTDLTKPWVFSIQSGLNEPSDVGASDNALFYGFSGVSCSNNICIAGGRYFNNSKIGVPVIAQTTDNGAHWSYGVWTGTNLPPGLNGFANFNSVSCSDEICIAGGYYQTGSGGHLMVAQSTDKGNTWTYPISVNNEPSDFVSSKIGINSVSCQGGVCTAAGAYFNGIKLVLFLAETDDAGVTWTFQITGSTSSQPDEFQFGQFVGTYASTNAFLPEWAQQLLSFD